MEYIWCGIKEAFKIILSFDKEFIGIVFISLKVCFISTSLAAIGGVSFGLFLTRKKFLGRRFITTILNTLMSLPTVLVGLLLYSFLSRKGPLGRFDLLYSISAMVMGQLILSFPIIAGFTVASVKSLDKRIRPTILAMGANSLQEFKMFLHEARFGILAAIIAGFGRVFAEVGISMMLGGNIKGYTRNITTAIALETGKGEFALGIALGIVLLSVSLIINILFTQLERCPSEHL